MASTSKIWCDISITILSDLSQLTRTQNDVSFRAILVKPVLNIFKTLGIISVVDIAATADMGHTMLHELTHAIKVDPTKDIQADKDISYSDYCMYTELSNHLSSVLSLSFVSMCTNVNSMEILHDEFSLWRWRHEHVAGPGVPQC